MGHLDGDSLAGGFLPMGHEGVVVLLVQLTGRVVADIGQRAVLSIAGHHKAQRQRRG